ncbi:hypothetical protein OHB53_09015 [Streptomyces sp. NBC_00056]|uniref:hypothetical protein n=1 Tax=Streptomyces sp. NBC_00056 TaxID=2975633 RepID=UPI003256845E
MPDSAAKPTDPTHALLSLLAKGQGSVDRLLALLRHAVLEVACDDRRHLKWCWR